jgi:predicted PurR-regulated permease PerM
MQPERLREGPPGEPDEPDEHDEHGERRRHPRPRPDLRRLIALLEGQIGVRSLALSGLFLLASFYTLYFGRSFFMPLVLATLFSLLLSPVVRTMKRVARVPEPLGAGVVMLALLGALGLGIYELSGPAYDWMAAAPQTLRKVEAKLRELKRPVATIGKATEQVEKFAQVGAGQAKPQQVTVQAPSWGERLIGQATDVVAGIFIMLVMLFFLLASGDLFLRKLIRVLPRLEDRKRAVEIARQVEEEVGRYLGTVTMMNAGIGTAVWISMALVGMPNPLLWGVMVFVSNFVPYLGSILCYIVIAVVGFLTFDTLGRCLLPLGIYLLLNFAEAYVVTPLVLGRRLTLNPVVLFLSLTFWGFLWGIPGAVLAVPIMVVFKIFCDHIEPLAPIGEFLGG